MARTHLAEDIQPLSAFRANAASSIGHLRRTKRALVLTQRGRSAAVVLDVAEYQNLIDELDTLRDVHRAARQLEAGKGIAHAIVKKSLLKRFRGR